MGKFEGIFIATDVDGTLVKSDTTISEENIEAIRYFQSEGGVFTIATGRYPDYVKENYANHISINDYLISLNGNIIYDMNSNCKVRVSKMDKADTQDIMDYIMSTFSDKINFINVCDEDESYRYEGSVERDTCKCVIVANDRDAALEIRDNLRNRCTGSHNIERSWPTGVEIYSKTSGKGEAVKYICSTLKPGIKKIICVGDYENDVSMLKAADTSYAVMNATDEAKAAADKICPVDNNNHAIAWIIRDLENEGI